MALHTLCKCYVHLVFSTKERRNLIPPETQERLWAYIGGVARENDMHALAVGGMPDHAHALITLPSTMSVAKAVQLLKGNSSKWLRETFPETSDFAWQEGYGAFSIGVSGVEETIAYIRSQPTHHVKRSFSDEVEAFCRKHGVSADDPFCRP